MLNSKSKKLLKQKYNSFAGLNNNFFYRVLFFIGILLLIFSYFLEKFDFAVYFYFLISFFGFVLVYSGGIIYFLKEKNNYLKCWNFIAKSRYYILFVLLIFILFFIMGLIFQPPEMADIIRKVIEDLLNKTKDFNFVEMLWFIFKNNSWVSFISVIFGLFFLVPLAITFSNGYLVGFVFSKAYASEGFSALFKLLPHGIFELPAVFISLAFGLKIGFFIFNHEPRKFLKVNFKESMRVFVFIIVPLLALAAIIETSLIFLMG